MASTFILNSASGIFRHTQALFKTTPTNIQNLLYPCQIQNAGTKHIQTSRYIHITLFNIFTKTSSGKFDTVLNVPYLYILSNLYSNFKVSSMLCSRHIQTYSRLIQPNSSILRTLAILKKILL